MGRKAKTQRFFVAVYPPPQITSWLQESVSDLAVPAHRMVSAEQVHLTVHFIGDIPASSRESVIESVERSVAGLSSFELTVFRMISLPAQAQLPKRVIAAETSLDSTLQEIKRRLVRSSARAYRRDPVDRFVPHLTLLRFTPSASEVDLNLEIRARSFEVKEICLMRSELKASGAVHHKIASAGLGEP